MNEKKETNTTANTNECSGCKNYQPIKQPVKPDYGWLCPRCGRGVAPTQLTCPICGPTYTYWGPYSPWYTVTCSNTGTTITDHLTIDSSNVNLNTDYKLQS